MFIATGEEFLELSFLFVQLCASSYVCKCNDEHVWNKIMKIAQTLLHEYLREGEDTLISY